MRQASRRFHRSNIATEIDRLSDKKLLRVRFCDLPIRLEGTLVEQRAQRVFAELAERRINVRPSIWLSEEWFNPDNVVGFAIPFYLVHPRLIRLERRLMLEAEGVAEKECLRILRHETGHAIDEAFQLYRTPEYADVFGSPRRRYPTSYAVIPHSRNHVVHLNSWYAQAHPVEDFAETFAMWLRPKRLWRRQYRDWPALRKLEAVDHWMTERLEQHPVLTTRAAVDELSDNDRTLAEHYDEKRVFYGVGATTKFDTDLRLIFPRPQGLRQDKPKFPSAVSVLRTIRTSLREELARPLGVPAYTVDQVLRQLIHRARALNLTHARSTSETINDVVSLVSRTTIDMLKNSPRLPL